MGMYVEHFFPVLVLQTALDSSFSRRNLMSAPARQAGIFISDRKVLTLKALMKCAQILVFYLSDARQIAAQGHPGSWFWQEYPLKSRIFPT
jgi:hypothetical protein